MSPRQTQQRLPRWSNTVGESYQRHDVRAYREKDTYTVKISSSVKISKHQEW